MFQIGPFRLTSSKVPTMLPEELASLPVELTGTVVAFTLSQTLSLGYCPHSVTVD